MLKNLTFIFAFLGLTSTPVQADIGNELSQYVGYTIVAVKTIARSVDKNGDKTHFEGCEFDRDIVFDDGTYVTCTNYGYQYAYRPKAIILSNGASMVMIVRDRVYRIR